jgi:hypothetical protein
MRSRHFSVVAFVLTSLLAWAAPASAEWSELVKEDEATYYFDKEAVMPVHVSRFAWVLTDLPKAEKTPTGENYKSMMLRVRMYCKNDTVVRLSVSYFDKQMGKGKEVRRCARMAPTRISDSPQHLFGGFEERSLRRF